MNELMIFEGHEVEIIELNGEVLFNPYHVGACLDLGDSAVRMAVAKMNEKQVVKIKNSDVKNFDIRNSDVTNGNIRKLNNAGENFLTESGVYKLVFKSHKPNAEKFTDWIADEVLPSIRKTGSYSQNEKSVIEQEISIVKFIADDLNVNTASRILMYENYCKDVGIPTGFLPKYEHNGSRQMKALSTLLKENGCTISAVKFNQRLIESGYLEEKERPSSSGKAKKYKALTDDGLQYGENAVNPHNQKEVQPLYYSDTFMELYNIVA